MIYQGLVRPDGYVYGLDVFKMRQVYCVEGAENETGSDGRQCGKVVIVKLRLW